VVCLRSCAVVADVVVARVVVVVAAAVGVLVLVLLTVVVDGVLGLLGRVDVRLTIAAGVNLPLVVTRALLLVGVVVG